MAYIEAFNENVIEFLKGQKTATVTLCTKTRLNSKIRKIAKERPDECQIDVENSDGSIVAHLPVKWIKINPSKIMTEEEKEIAKQRGREMYEKNKDKLHRKHNLADDEDEEDDLFDFGFDDDDEEDDEDE